MNTICVHLHTAAAPMSRHLHTAPFDFHHCKFSILESGCAKVFVGTAPCGGMACSNGIRLRELLVTDLVSMQS